jgi:hypothetical protein
MPTYDGIGSSVTHEIEVVGDVFISNVEGGSLSTQVPFEIFSNVSGMVSPPTDSRQLRLRVQPTTEASPDDSYVTDMGIQNTTDNYFFITAPQNTSNVGDQNTFVISKTSNVGIGTTDPTEKLHVDGNILATGTVSASPDLVTTHILGKAKIGGTGGAARFGHYDFFDDAASWALSQGASGATFLNRATGKDIQFKEADSSTQMIIKSGGYVGINMTSPTEKLHVDGNILATGDITAFSDKRHKEDLVVIESALDKVKRLTGYTYTLHGNRSAGLLAQDVLEVLPEVVKGSEETNYSLAYGNLMGLVVEAIKDLDKKIDRILEKQ